MQICATVVVIATYIVLIPLVGQLWVLLNCVRTDGRRRLYWDAVVVYLGLAVGDGG